MTGVGVPPIVLFLHYIARDLGATVVLGRHPVYETIVVEHTGHSHALRLGKDGSIGHSFTLQWLFNVFYCIFFGFDIFNRMLVHIRRTC